MSEKINVLLVGCGGIGAVAALNLEKGEKANVTAVLRSNYDAANANGFHFRSIDHGLVEGFRPSSIRKTIPDIISENLEPYKYIVVATKNTPDVSAPFAPLIASAVTPEYTSIVLIQNGLNIEKPVAAAFPTNSILSGVSFCSSYEDTPAHFVHGEHDKLFIGAFDNPGVDPATASSDAKTFCEIYAAGGKCVAEFRPDVAWDRWRKLLYNACYNPICAVLDMDSGRMQLADGGLEGLISPAMEEIRSAAAACGVVLGAELVDEMVRMDPITMYYAPSMQVDVQRGRYTEFENLVGEPLREGEAKGVKMPTLRVVYSLLKTMQWRVKEKNCLVKIPDAVDRTAV